MAKEETITVEIRCYTTNLLLAAARDVPVMAMPFKIIDTRIRELNDLIKESGNERMNKIMELLGYRD